VEAPSRFDLSTKLPILQVKVVFVPITSHTSILIPCKLCYMRVILYRLMKATWVMATHMLYCFFYVSNLIIIMFLLLTKYVLLPQNFFVGVNHGQEVGSLH